MTLVLCLTPYTFAQTGEVQDEGIQAGLEVGMQIPDVTIYDSAGDPFDLSDRLKGSPAVIVFGCLT